MKIRKLLLAAVGATVLLAALVTSASARTFSVSNQNLRAQFREVRFTLPEGTVNCQVTLEGSLHARSIAKIAGSLIGYITRAVLGPCAVGRATILTATLPWHVQYAGFEGTLPAITQIRTNVINASFRVTNGFFNCLARTSAANPAVGNFNISGGSIATAEIGGSIPTGAECFGATGNFTSDRGVVGLLNAISTRITVTLI